MIENYEDNLLHLSYSSVASKRSKESLYKKDKTARHSTGADSELSFWGHGPVLLSFRVRSFLIQFFAIGNTTVCKGPWPRAPPRSTPALAGVKDQRYLVIENSWDLLLY